MDRRTFIKGGLGAGVLVTLTGTACEADGAGGRPPPPFGSQVNTSGFELEELTIDQLQEGMEVGRFTARSLTEGYIERIEAVDRQGPGLYAVLEVNPDALSIAEDLDRARQNGEVRGPLHGIPILLKDNIDTADRTTTTAGSTALLGSISPQDSFVAARLRDAGAVLLGKANMSEWAGWKSFVRGTPGWSGRGWNGGEGGFCRNPYALNRVPGGSSSGSGVAAAANLAAATIGTETDGSIVGPSSLNCLVGIKPTIGLASRGGIIPIAHSQDSAGPMARTVRDAALILGVLTGVDPRDPATQASAGRYPESYLDSLDPDGLSGARIGVARAYAGFDERVDRLLEDALEVFRGQGAVVVDDVQLPPELRFGNEFEMEVLYHEFKADLNAYLDSLGPGAPIRSLAELIEYNERNARLELALFPQELLIRSQERGPLTDPVYLNALATSHRLSRAEGIDRVMDAQRLDAIVAPTSGLPAPLDPVAGSRSSGGGCSTPSAMAGYPIMTVPMGYVFGLPIGLAFFGRAWSEPTLIRLGFAYEQATKHRRPPAFLQDVDVLAHI